ncbi:uncharacterized protein LOC110693498 [Chenopodium quinoa]|uniref:uncharacterized protein LOC110693498 n=1 Tax=Chenopodium quinoa TaxID=63459 RepID=UPI000B78B51A|nr:uncharacterized protein LOC110693498 [Chenopodium quinoa]
MVPIPDIEVHVVENIIDSQMQEAVMDTTGDSLGSKQNKKIENEGGSQVQEVLNVDDSEMFPALADVPVATSIPVSDTATKSKQKVSKTQEAKKKKSNTSSSAKKPRKEILYCSVPGHSEEEALAVLREKMKEFPDGEDAHKPSDNSAENSYSSGSSSNASGLLSCSIDCGENGGYTLQLTSESLRPKNNRKKIYAMKELRLKVADYCFVENYSGVKSTEVIVTYSDIYQLPREEFQTLIPGQFISCRVMDCFYILLNWEEVLAGFKYNRVFFWK